MANIEFTGDATRHSVDFITSFAYSGGVSHGTVPHTIFLAGTGANASLLMAPAEPGGSRAFGLRAFTSPGGVEFFTVNGLASDLPGLTDFGLFTNAQMDALLAPVLRDLLIGDDTIALTGVVSRFWGDIDTVTAGRNLALGDDRFQVTAINLAAPATSVTLIGDARSVAVGATAHGGNDSLFGFGAAGQTNTVLTIFGDFEQVLGTATYGNDTIVGGGGDDTIYGDAPGAVSVGGNDTIYGHYGADLILGGGGNDVIRGGPGDIFDTFTDTISGQGGNDIISGSNGANTLDGGAGNDVINGLQGADMMFGGSGNDMFVVDVVGDSITEAAGAAGGVDRVRSAALSINLTSSYANVENAQLLGSTALNLTGDSGANVLVGNAGANVLLGISGNDTLTGGAGVDTLNGGAGKDVLSGGTQNDTFKFSAKTHSAVGANADRITDFDDPGKGNDRIDVSALFGPTMTYRHALAFTASGQVRINDIAGADVIVEVNTSGTLAADFSIRLTGTTLASMTKSDFVL